MLPLGKGKNMSQWEEVLHKHDAYIPFSIHNQRILFSAIIINLFQILPIENEMSVLTQKKNCFLGFYCSFIQSNPLIWHSEAQGN